MDFRFRGNDKKGNENDIKEVGNDRKGKILWAYCNTPLPLILKRKE